MKYGASDYVVKTSQDAFNRLEIAIKNVLHSMEMEHDLKKQKKFIALLAVVVIVLAVLAIYYSTAQISSIVILLLFWFIISIVGLRFLKRKTIVGSKTIELASGLWALSMYILLGDEWYEAMIALQKALCATTERSDEYDCD